MSLSNDIKVGLGKHLNICLKLHLKKLKNESMGNVVIYIALQISISNGDSFKYKLTLNIFLEFYRASLPSCVAVLKYQFTTSL